LLYTLAGIDNPATGWGRSGETWTFMAALQSLGGETWFKLGDGDLATHIERTRRLAAGESLSQITDDFRRRLRISARLLPMTDDPVRTRLLTPEGWLDFQDYFVRRQCAPSVHEIAFAGAKTAHPYADFLAALANHNLRMVAICPSNPFISIDPILSLPGVREALRACPAPVVAVSPIIGGKAVKGPTAKMMAELGLPVGAAAVARHYGDILDHYVIEEAHIAAMESVDRPFTATRTLMETLADRDALARVVLAAGRGC
jgi:LPPG:FO 2-phospho-L-lactate transferase